MNDTIWWDGDAREAERRLREECFHHYGNLARLAASGLAQSSLIAGCLLVGDGEEVRGLAVQVTLDWAFEKLRQVGTERYRQSADVLQMRYIEGFSNKGYADLRFIDDQTAHSRRKRATQRVLTILRQEGETPRGLSERKQIIIERRLEACSAEELLLLRVLAIFSSPSVVGAACERSFGQPIAIEMLTPLAEIALERSLYPLLSKNLLRSDADVRQIHLHPELRDYLLTLLAPDERLRWHAAAAAFYEQEGQVLRAVKHYQLAGQPLAAAGLLIEQQEGLGDSLPIAPLRECLADFKRNDLPADMWAELQLMLGRAAERSKELKVAREAYEQALSSANQPTLRAEAYYLLAGLYEQQDIDAAFIHYDACQRLLTTIETRKERELLVKSVIWQAWFLILHRPDFERAEENLQQAEQLLANDQQAHHLRSDLHTTWGIFYTYSPKACPKLEYEHFWRAWQEAKEAQNLDLQINTTYNLGVSCRRLGKYEQARQHLAHCQALSVQAGNRRVESLSKKGLGDCYRSDGAYQKALDYYLEAYHDFQQKGYHYWLGEVCEDLVVVFIALGKPDLAKPYFEQGKSLATQLENEPLKAKFEQLEQSYIELTADLNPRQGQAIGIMRQTGEIANRHYQKLTDCAQKTAAKDLKELLKKGICERVGKGRGTRYRLVGVIRENNN